jgi:branched-chain amino acid transport system permease protein
MKRTPLLILGVGVLLAFLPRLGLPAFYDSLLYLMLHWIVLATSWNILSGYTGYFSFGHGAFFGAGIYTTSTLLARYDWPFGPCRSRRWWPRCSAWRSARSSFASRACAASCSPC